jgi:malonyl CoA-acyl carrier protein transacylase
MDEKKGHFEKGRWVEDIPASDDNNYSAQSKNSEGKTVQDDVDRIIAETAGSLKIAVENIISLGNTVIGTKEGREKIEKKAQKAGEKLLKQVEDVIEDARKKL